MEKFKALTTQQKIGYIRDYYTIHIVATVATIAILIWGLNHYIFNPPPSTFVNISFYGQFVPEELRSMFAEDLTNSLVAEGENYAVVVENFFTSGDPQFDMAVSQRMVALITARELDVFIVAPGRIEGFLETGFARVLSDMLAVDDIARLDDLANLSYFNSFGYEFWVNFDRWTMIVMANTARDEAVGAFLDYVLLFSGEYE